MDPYLESNEHWPGFHQYLAVELATTLNRALVALNEPLPVIPVPLLSPDPDLALDLNQAVQTAYDHGAYHWQIDYHQLVPPPKLRPAMAEWLREFQISS